MHTAMRRPHSPRAPRVRIPNKERAIVALGSQEMVGVLCKLSITGGSLRLSTRPAKGTVAELTLKATSGRITCAIEFLGPADKAVPPAQAFRFIHMGIPESRRLENALEEMRKQGFGEKTSWKFHPIARVALQTLKSITSKR
jgi:hypothetical protein